MLQQGPGRASPLDVAAAGRRTGAAGDCRERLARNRSANAKKNDLKPWRYRMWCIPPEHNAEFVCAMENVLEVVYTPKHGSWLNIAEIELNVLTRQCLCRRIGDGAVLMAEVGAWDVRRNENQTGVDWQFTTADARVNLKRLYPRIQS